MVNWFRKLFGLKPNDWCLIWSDTATTDCYWRTKEQDKYPYKVLYFHYDIYYSASRRKLKLSTHGNRHPDKHHFYRIAKQKLIELQKQYNTECK